MLPRRFQTNVPEGCPLTNCEYEILVLLSAGLSMKQVAARRQCHRSTVNSLMSNAYKRLGVHGGQTQAVVLMKDSGWLGALPRRPQDPPDPSVTPVQLAYAACFVRLCRERTSRAAALVTVAYGLLVADRAWAPSRPRRPPDIDALLLRMARGLQRPI